ncbi:similar to Saccharomyces cerevisiae YBR028C YPK3 An AGC kinase phosphorylated by cAMP- dependent protein kinase (PKA) in a TORC1-dependent manner [Maudiozyma barnettii]|uniref:Similar to Saccharomyces cerevisiae YBR028C YPK3 An AGC kinase phosphorylated by cAMP- dependent protein kinase (PKA) in a TORC1-dependent manner n=1 Tax=Maudiozyma barnettii TaxID=61262 RepID=A0A8H2ZFE9_9SACH|nr:putative protein kinase YPK3 [Kazachstania barnettii]CAB4253151.1 similar to Saccharomyces cerevisiae YBR028C YPK3 An AGC kinase phosphorylated by cAMP- dependent protein kinase (PKA) in a TORC1-dependent manner [Kazachstania barnettii]CAD1780313.1 similar to Saccharomyces cerevisiae YBR028C YPK3 An AGC kinase phosphorylated by cAMP- dependent protein kinase (PKA) in a TORC1-dependent manner [Kazachstania barnettii]
MVFSLDEELSNVTLHDDDVNYNNGIPVTKLGSKNEDLPSFEFNDNLMTMDEHLNTQTSPEEKRTRRRSSVLAKFPVLSPVHTRRVSISNNSPNVVSHLTSSFRNTPSDIAVQKENINTGSIIGEAIDMRPTTVRTIQDFKPIRVLGKGAYGKVILVKDKYSTKLYAMKQLKKAEILINDNDKKNTDKENDNIEVTDELTMRRDLDKRIERTFAERTILSQLEHPNIVKLFYSFHDQSKLYLILQYIPGGELFYHLKEHGTLEEDTVAFYAAEVSCALKFLHDNGIVYRDLKPENCLLNQRGHLVLTDFGLSKKGTTDPTNDSTSSDSDLEKDDIYTLHSIIGTPEYAAPEILQGLAYNKNCDWYSLGCLLYDMLVGKPPYTGNNHKVILNKIQKDKQGPRIPYYLSEGMKDMLNWLLKKDKTKRWDVDRYWREEPIVKQKGANNNNNKKKKAGKQRVTKFQSHFIFRKINWKEMETGYLQKTTLGPIVPIITDWELAENFDTEFTSMSFEENHMDDGIPIAENKNHSLTTPDIFKGFSFKASGSYLERHF